MEAAGKNVEVKHVGEVRGGLVVKGFMGKEKDFKVNLKLKILLAGNSRCAHKQTQTHAADNNTAAF